MKSHEEQAILLQAQYRGFIVPSTILRPGLVQRRAYQGLKRFWASQEDKIIKIQAKWRMIVQRRKFMRQLAFFKVNEKTIIRIQAAFKGSIDRVSHLIYSGLLQRRKFRAWLADMKSHEEQAILLQAQYRGFLCDPFSRQDWCSGGLTRVSSGSGRARRTRSSRSRRSGG